MKLISKDRERAYEIVDIQFAMSDYQYLEDVVGMKKISQGIERIDLTIKHLRIGIDDDKIEKHMMKKDELLQQ